MVWRFFLGSRSHSCFKSYGISLLTNLCFLSRKGAYTPTHCWFQRLSRAGNVAAAGDIAAGDIVSGPFSAAAIKSLSKQETERKEQKSDFLHYPCFSLEVSLLVILAEILCQLQAEAKLVATINLEPFAKCFHYCILSIPVGQCWDVGTPISR